MKTTRAVLQIAVISFWCSSCVVPKRFQHGVIKTAAVTEVIVPDKMMYPETKASGSFGKQVLGALVVGAALGAMGPPSGASTYMAGQAIGGGYNAERGYVRDETLRAFFASELKRCLEQRLTETKLLSISSQNQTQGRISIDVFRWGFLEGKAGSLKSHFEKSRAMPTGWITIEMKNAEGRLLWRKEFDSLKALASHPDLVPRRSLDDYERTPALKKQDLSVLADSLAKLAANDIARP